MSTEKLPPLVVDAPRARTRAYEDLFDVTETVPYGYLEFAIDSVFEIPVGSRVMAALSGISLLTLNILGMPVWYEEGTMSATASILDANRDTLAMYSLPSVTERTNRGFYSSSPHPLDKASLRLLGDLGAMIEADAPRLREDLVAVGDLQQAGDRVRSALDSYETELPTLGQLIADLDGPAELRVTNASISRQTRLDGREISLQWDATICITSYFGGEPLIARFDYENTEPQQPGGDVVVGIEGFGEATTFPAAILEIPGASEVRPLSIDVPVTGTELAACAPTPGLNTWTEDWGAARSQG